MSLNHNKCNYKKPDYNSLKKRFDNNNLTSSIIYKRNLNNYSQNRSETIPIKFNEEYNIILKYDVINFSILQINKDIDLNLISHIYISIGGSIHNEIPFSLLRYTRYLHKLSSNDYTYNYFSLEFINNDILSVLLRYHNLNFCIKINNKNNLQDTTYNLIVNYKKLINNPHIKYMEIIRTSVIQLINSYYYYTYNSEHDKHGINKIDNKNYKIELDCHMQFVNGIFIECNNEIDNIKLIRDGEEMISNLNDNLILLNNYFNKSNKKTKRYTIKTIDKYNIYWIPFQKNLSYNEISTDIDNINECITFSHKLWENPKTSLYLSLLNNKENLDVKITYSYYNIRHYMCGICGNVYSR
jgi:hypothetical protein